MVDLRYREANEAACLDMGMARDGAIGRTVLELPPGLPNRGRCPTTSSAWRPGSREPWTTIPCDNEVHADSRRWLTSGSLPLAMTSSASFRDVTDRFQAAQRAPEAARASRNPNGLTACWLGTPATWSSMFATAGSPGARPRSPTLSGRGPEYRVGRRVLEIIPPEDEVAFAARLATLAAGGTVQERIRVVAVDGVTHWADARETASATTLAARTGLPPRCVSSTTKWPPNRDAKEARRHRARSRCPYTGDQWTVRRSGCAWSTPRAASFLTSTRRCEFFGYDADALKSKTWQALTAEADIAGRYGQRRRCQRAASSPTA